MKLCANPTGEQVLLLVSADIPDIIIKGGTLTLEAGVSVYVQQEESFSARLHHIFLPVTHSSVGVSDYTLTEDTWLISRVDNVCETIMCSVNIAAGRQQKVLRDSPQLWKSQ